MFDIDTTKTSDNLTANLATNYKTFNILQLKSLHSL